MSGLGDIVSKHCIPEPNTGCWLWTGSLDSKGYGMAHIRRGIPRRLAHRVSWEVYRGPLPCDLVLDHTCRVRSCVNPDHLRAVTRGANVLCGESPSAKHARQTHCLRGHEFTPANTYRTKEGWRHCKACLVARRHEPATLEVVTP